MEKDDEWLKYRVDKLERAFQLVIDMSQPQASSIRTHPRTDQVSHCQDTSEIWSSNRSWNPGGQADVYQHEYLHYGEQVSSRAPPQWRWPEENLPFPYQLEPHPSTTHVSSWQMGNPDYQSYPDFQKSEPSQPVHQTNYSKNCPPFQDQPQSSWSPNAEDYIPTWQGKDWQAQSSHSYQDQVHLSQDQYASTTKL